jgi:hypothetical protein
MVYLQKDRFDIFIKMVYLNERIPFSLRQRAYRQHIKIITEGRYREPDHKEKSDFQDYEETFNKLKSDVQAGRFDWKKSGRLPLNKNGVLVNGAHRLACHLYCGKEVITFLDPSASEISYPAQYFMNSGMSKGSALLALNEVVHWNKNIKIGLVWPRAYALSERFEPENEFFRFELQMSIEAMRDMVATLYSREEWIGLGVEHKLEQVAKRRKNVCTFVFYDCSIEQSVSAKSSFRNLANIGKHSIHSTDSRSEAIQLISQLYYLVEGWDNLKQINEKIRAKQGDSFLYDGFKAGRGRGGVYKTLSSALAETKIACFLLWIGLKRITVSISKKNRYLDKILNIIKAVVS